VNIKFNLPEYQAAPDEVNFKVYKTVGIPRIDLATEKKSAKRIIFILNLPNNLYL